MRRSEKVVIAVLISILLHAFLLGLGAYMSVLFPPTAETKAAPQEVEVVSLIPNHGFQIADISPPEKEERPDDARFLGMYDSKVKQETVGGQTGPEAHAAGKPKSHKELTQQLEKHPEKPVKAPTPKEILGKDDDGVKVAAKPPPKKTKPSEQENTGPSGSDGEDYFEGLSNDYFPDYKVGDRTYLNVFKFPKISYFVRMKKIFRTTFNPGPSIRQSSLQIQRGQIEVVLGVTVDRTGKLADLMVIHSSGNPAYDQEALRTIKDSAPFAAPPSELLNAPGALRMAWTFTVYL
ncbi:MAG TPA: TonB family protein [bacterium]|nr:TonB family protein [bacterium]